MNPLNVESNPTSHREHGYGFPTGSFGPMSNLSMDSAPTPFTSHLAAVLDMETDNELISYLSSIKKLLPLALPSILSVSMVTGVWSITFACVGQMLGTEALSAVSVAFFFTCLLALYPLTGLAFAVDTLCTQAFGRDPFSTVQGAVTQRSLVISTVCMIPVAFLMQHADILLLRWYEKDVALLAAEWVRYTPLYVLPTVYCTTFSKFLCSQLLPHLPTIALIAAAASTPILQIFCIQRFGFLGSIYALAASAWVQLATLLILTFRHPDSNKRFGKFRNIWRNITAWKHYKTFFRFGLPSVVFVCAESGAFDITVLLAANFDATSVAAWTVMTSTFLVADCICSGVSIAATACVGSALGAGRPKRARRIAKAALLLVTCWACLNAVLMYVFHQEVYSLFTDDPKVLKVLDKFAWIIVPLHISDSIQFVFQGIFSGSGQNHTGAVALVTSLWGVGVGSICYFIWFTHIGLFGVPLGLTMGLVVACPMLAYLCFYRFDWKELAYHAKKLVEEAELQRISPKLGFAANAIPQSCDELDFLDLGPRDESQSLDLYTEKVPLVVNRPGAGPPFYGAMHERNADGTVS